jgi:hypothetical protein
MIPGDKDDGREGVDGAVGALVVGVTLSTIDGIFVLEDGGAKPGMVGPGVFVGIGEVMLSAQISKLVTAPPPVINKQRRVSFNPIGMLCTDPLPSPVNATRTGVIWLAISTSMKSLVLVSIFIKPIEITSDGLTNWKHKTPPLRLSSGNTESDS